MQSRRSQPTSESFGRAPALGNLGDVRMRWLVLVLCLSGCDNPINTGPPTTPTPPTTTSITPGLPRVDVPFDFNAGVGFTLFAGARAHEMDIRMEFSRAQLRLGVGSWARVCAEVQSWPGGDRPWLPRGVSAAPYDESAPAYLELKNFLDVAATIHGAQVLVIAICNLKEDGTSPANREKWVGAVARLANGYQNTAIEVVNEFVHQNSDISEAEMMALIRTTRRNFDGMIGTDDGVRRGNMRYNGALRGLVDFVSFHPCRTDTNPGGLDCDWRGGSLDPAPADLREMYEKNGEFVLSETVGFDDFNRPGGCCTDDRNRIIEYMNDCKAIDGCTFLYHCVGNLGWPETRCSWYPEAR